MVRTGRDFDLEPLFAPLNDLDFRYPADWLARFGDPIDGEICIINVIDVLRQ